MIATKLPPNCDAGPNIPSWRLEDHQTFTIKSAYDHIRAPTDNTTDPCWKRVWKLQVLQRIRVFLLLVLHCHLLTNVERTRRHLTNLDCCEICLDNSKDLIHVLRDCLVARDLWAKILPSLQIDSFSQVHADEWLRVNLFALAGLLSVSKEWPRKFETPCWLMWKNRCCHVMGSECMHREELLVRRFGVMRGSLERWKCPPLGAVIGGVIRDGSGSWVFGYFRVIGRCSALVAELWAIYDAFRRDWEFFFHFVEIEFDCLEAVQMILGKSEICIGHALVAEIKTLMSRDWHLSIIHIHRECNGCADRMLALGRGQDLMLMDFEDPLVELLDLIEEEASSSF
ncbi:hypothetical protein GQ457_06G009310 [Hibiscus cannabinus]